MGDFAGPLLSSDNLLSSENNETARDELNDRQYLGSLESDTTFVPLHPLGVKPSGNAFTADSNIRTAIGSFSQIPDELIVLILETLDQETLVNLGTTCKTFYAFSRTEDLWKALFIQYDP